MVDRRTLNYMLQRPHRLAAYMATGKLPELPNPSSPLITLLKSLHPRERMQVTNIKLHADLGYQGVRNFRNAELLLNALSPQVPQSNVPSMSWQDRRFQKVLTIDDLAASAQVPPQVTERWWARHQQLRHLKR